MAKKKTFSTTDLSIPAVEHVKCPNDVVAIPPEILPPTKTKVEFVRGMFVGPEHFDFQTFYGLGIDPIVYVCQRQIERFLIGQDKELTHLTIRSLCSALAGFFEFLARLRIERRRELELVDLNRELIDEYLIYLSDVGVSKSTQKSRYSATKSVLKCLCRRKIVNEITGTDDATFPRNPFSGVHRTHNGARPLSKAQRQAFSAAVKTAVMPIFSANVQLTSELLGYALLIVALHTGRNTWPLLELTRDCLRSHPKDDRVFLMVYKRRGYSTTRVAMRADQSDCLSNDSAPSIRSNVARLIRRVLELSTQLAEEAPPQLRDRVWLYRMRTPGAGKGAVGQISSLNPATLERTIKLLIGKFKLTDTDGRPLHISVSRLRKTFVNRTYEILDGDIVSAAAAAGHGISVTGTSYLRPSDQAKKNWKFMGIALVSELLRGNLGATERTPVGQCSDPQNGDYAPKREGATCMDFLSCLRCRNYVVAGDDLHRLFSFYWRILAERTRMQPKRWKREFSHIIRMIDQDVVEAGLSQGIFKAAFVESERERARTDPHPFWRMDTVISDLSGGSF